MNSPLKIRGRVAAGLLVSVALLACDASAPLTVPEGTQLASLTVVEDNVSLRDKQAALNGAGALRTPSLAPASSSYSVDLIPFAPEAEPTLNEGPFCDDCVMNDVPIGFPFTFYGNTYNTLQISSNGFLRFDPANNDSGCCSGRVIPVDDTWNNIIAVIWTDLNPSAAGAGRIFFETRGAAPNRRFVLQFDNVTIWPNTDPRVHAQLILYEGTNVIEIHTEFLDPWVQNITQGIENADGTEAAFVEGRVATTFSLENDGVRFTPEQVEPCEPVEIDNAYSGLPAQDPGVISLEDDWVFVEILDIAAFLGRPATADQVRIGDDWETGTPAESFEILDINMDGNLDIRLRWSVDQLVADGNLSTATEELEVWGLDMTDGQLYCGSHPVRVIDDEPPPAICFDNGGFVTHPEAGAGGADVSMASLIDGISSAGSNTRLVAPIGPHFRIADDFTVGAEGCIVTQVVTHGYETGQAVPTWSQAHMNIWDGEPGVAGSNIIASTTTTNWDWSGVYRVFNGLANLGNTDRPVHEIYFDFDNLDLGEGTYWIDWQVQGGVSGWANYRMEPDPVTPGGAGTITVFDNGRHMFNSAGEWQPILGPPGAETPFRVTTGAPATGTGLGVPSVGRPIMQPRGYDLREVDSTRRR